MPIELPPPRLLELTGPDAVAFAQAQFCNDVLALADGQWQWNAWLSGQGRVLAFFRLLRTNATHLSLTLRGGDATWMRAELARYVFRTKVQIAVVDGASEPATLDDIRAGLPEIGVALRDRLLPQWLGLDRLGAVSVRKGCYPGQEIMARLHFKGGNKRSLHRIRTTSAAPVEAGSVLHETEGGGEAGVVVASAQAADGSVEALACLSDAKAAAQLSIDGHGQIAVLQRFA